MKKTYKARFAGMYNGLRFLNNILQTDDEELQKKIESWPYFKRGEIILVNTIDANEKEPEETSMENDIEAFDYSGMSMPALRKKASENGLKVPRTAKKDEIINMLMYQA